MKLTVYDLVPELPEHGPELPHACDDGWESHEWTLVLDEAQIDLSSNCQRCNHGVRVFRDAYPEEFGSAEMRVRLHFEHDHGQPWYGIDPYCYLWVEPVGEVGDASED